METPGRLMVRCHWWALIIATDRGQWLLQVVARQDGRSRGVSHLFTSMPGRLKVMVADDGQCRSSRDPKSLRIWLEADDGGGADLWRVAAGVDAIFVF